MKITFISAFLSLLRTTQDGPESRYNIYEIFMRWEVHSTVYRAKRSRGRNSYSAKSKDMIRVNPNKW